MERELVMRLEGSCHCGAVRFRLDSTTPYPYMRCYCSICRKTAGGGGYAINIMGTADTLVVDGREHVTVYRVGSHPASGETVGEDVSPARRHFCGHCGSALWVFDPRWPDLVHPFASAIDTPLPPAPEHVHIMLESRAPWVEVPNRDIDEHFSEYPELSIADWHRSRGLLSD